MTQAYAPAARGRRVGDRLRLQRTGDRGAQRAARAGRWERAGQVSEFQVWIS